jgi:hypothetical protein
MSRNLVDGRRMRCGLGEDKRGFAFTFTAMILALIMISGMLCITSLLSGPISLTYCSDGVACNQIFRSALIGAAVSASRNGTSPLNAARSYLDSALGPLHADPSLESITPEETWNDLAVDESSSTNGSAIYLECGGYSLSFEVKVVSLTTAISTNGVTYFVNFSYSATINGDDINGGAPDAYVDGQLTNVFCQYGNSCLISFVNGGNAGMASISIVDPTGVRLTFEIPLG